MEKVEPIRSEKQINSLKKYLIGAGNMRNYALIIFGINSALRISDILSLTWVDTFDFNENKFREHVWVQEKKTKKKKKFLLNQSAKDALDRLRKQVGSINPDVPIFASRVGDNKAITRHMASIIIKDACESVGIKEKIGCHSLRKTFGYHSWKKGVPLPVLTELYNHSNQAVTKCYLGISQDDIDDVYRLVEL